MSGVRVGVADSGVNPRHPQVRGVKGGADFRLRDGRVEIGGDFEDRLGHGTAVAATIRGHAPFAEIYALRIFRRRLATHSEVVLAAIDWAVLNRLHVLNLSFAIKSSAQEDALASAAERARRAELILVHPAVMTLPGGIGVVGDASLLAGECRWTQSGSRKLLVASTWAREIVGLPQERNLHGVSLAVAHVTGLTARSLRDLPRIWSQDSLIDALVKLWGLKSVPQMGD